MSLFTEIFGGNGGKTIEVAGKVVTDLLTDNDKREQEIQLLRAENERLKLQTDTNNIEAASERLFVSGWRPFVGWICGIALLYVSLIEPIFRFISVVGFDYHGNFPVIDTTITGQVLGGMLGLGFLRSADKGTFKK